MTQRSGQALIELKNIRKVFTDFRLERVDLDIKGGEVHVLVGENGSGKSTLMKLISGYFLPDAGTICYKGEEVRFRTINEAARNGILYLHQDVQSFDNLTVAENVFFGRLPRLWGMPRLVDLNKVLADCYCVFRELGVEIDPEQHLGSLGFAERQLIAAVRGYISNAELVIFDEPSSAMSEPDRTILFDIVSRLKRRDTAIFYISHRMDEIQRVGDRVSVMHKGNIIATQTGEAIDREQVLRMMAGDSHKERYPRLGSKRGSMILETKNLTLEPILKGVSLCLHSGEMLGITGLMGSGRTLLANCLFGTVRPSSGDLILYGKNVSFNHPSEAMSMGISMIPEDRAENGIFHRHNLLHNITSATLARFRHKAVLDERFMRELSQEYIHEMNINPGKIEDILETYSGGNQQKVMVSRWLMKRSKIYIMDEPTRGIDAASKVDIYNTMNDMVDKGAAIILISSEIEEILGMSDRVLVLAGGRIACEMSRNDATKEKILEYATEDS